MFLILIFFFICGFQQATASTYGMPLPTSRYEYSIELVGEIPPELTVKYSSNDSGRKTPAIFNHSSKSLTFQTPEDKIYRLVDGKKYLKSTNEIEWKLINNSYEDGFLLDVFFLINMGLPIEYVLSKNHRPRDIQIPNPHRIRIPFKFDGRDLFLEVEVTYFLSKFTYRVYGGYDNYRDRIFLIQLLLGLFITSVIISFLSTRSLMKTKKMKQLIKNFTMKIIILTIINVVFITILNTLFFFGLVFISNYFKILLYFPII